jgi:hypothetical protein
VAQLVQASQPPGQLLREVVATQPVGLARLGIGERRDVLPPKLALLIGSLQGPARASHHACRESTLPSARGPGRVREVLARCSRLRQQGETSAMRSSPTSTQSAAASRSASGSPRGAGRRSLLDRPFPTGSGHAPASPPRGRPHEISISGRPRARARSTRARPAARRAASACPAAAVGRAEQAEQQQARALVIGGKDRPVLVIDEVAEVGDDVGAVGKRRELVHIADDDPALRPSARAP